ncbi:elongation factor P 5-aminopentanone reductase [Caproiciproducens faecalis]|uniref:3-oxoacyl-ACP reductase FabG n=1 Tax=Caproiciproducens faecalis TaxID=2820301 RepID=A0ABS7DPC9_9FIRM|nr:3-oxoacyl-ACP reductase FabG [Caproiciproducens faecalis]MBW7573123.1 3-oxoacyl-ACP reductase FabG [Caproiciproducens faecalis]
MKTALVTGASRGIGKAVASRLAADGFRVIVNYCASQGQAEALAAELNTLYSAGCTAIQADVSDRAQVEKMFAAAGEIDVLVNNAGIAQQKLFTDLTEQDWDRMFDVDVKGMFHCCQCALPYMIRQKRGKIINVSSMWGQVGASCEVHYSAAKAAVIGLTKALAKEVGPSGIQVNCVAPGVIETEMNAKLDADTIRELREETPLGVIGAAEDIAAAVSFLAGENSRFITGQVLGVNGGMII